MDTTAKGHPDAGSNPELDAIVSDLAALRRHFAKLTDHLKSGGIKGAKGAARDTAKRLYENLAEQGERSMKRSAVRSRNSRL
jgi:hypothetical protein